MTNEEINNQIDSKETEVSNLSDKVAAYKQTASRLSTINGYLKDAHSNLTTAKETTDKYSLFCNIDDLIDSVDGNQTLVESYIMSPLDEYIEQLKSKIDSLNSEIENLKGKLK